MGLQQNMTSEPVSRLAMRKPILCSPEDRLKDVISRMREHDLGCVFVVDDNHQPVGMFTESMLTHQLAHGEVAFDDPIKSHMALQWPWVRQTDPIADVLEAMNLKNTRFICVVDENGRAVGLTGQKGLMEYIAEHFPSQVMVQRVGCAPTLDREGA